MIALDCDTAEVERALAALHDEVAAEGAWFHPAVRIAARAGELSVFADAVAATGRLMEIPEACLPVLELYDLRVDGKGVRIAGRRAEADETGTRCLERMLDLFNVSGKLARHRDSCPWFALASAPELMRALAEGRRGGQTVDDYRALFEAGDTGTLLRESLLGSRKLDFASSRCGRQVAVLMPFIDLLNHHSRAGTFRRADGERREGALVVDVSRPAAGCDECFVRYSPVDALDSYLIYGFVDETAPHLRSVPLRLDVGGGARIDAGARLARPFAGDLPPALRDLRPFMPRMRRGRDRLEVSHLLVPGPHAPQALRRVLGVLIRSVRPGIAAAALNEAVQRAESEVIEANARYYDGLARLARVRESDAPATAAAKAVVRSLAEAQACRLDTYRARLAPSRESAPAGAIQACDAERPTTSA